MEQRVEDVKELIGGVPGFASYAAFRSDDGVTTVTVCQDKAGIDESSNRAAAWIKENVSDASVDPPEITEGATFYPVLSGARKAGARGAGGQTRLS